MSKRKKQYRENLNWMCNSGISNKEKRKIIKDYMEIKEEYENMPEDKVVEAQPIESQNFTYEIKLGLDITPAKVMLILFMLYLVYLLAN